MNSRDKGKRGELEFAKYLREHGYEGARRGQQFAGGPGSPDVLGMPGVHWEVKYGATFNPYGALDQSKRDAGAGELPLVAYRKCSRRGARSEWLVVMDLEKLFELYASLSLAGFMP